MDYEGDTTLNDVNSLSEKKAKILQWMQKPISLGPPSEFMKDLVEKFEFLPDRDAVLYHQAFVNGEMNYLVAPNATAEERLKYYCHCIQAVDYSFNLTLGNQQLRDSLPILLPILAGAIEDMEQQITQSFKQSYATITSDPENARDHFPLDAIPFRYLKRRQLYVHDLPKDDESRIAFQALFLFLLRPRIPIKYSTVESFLEKYQELRDRSCSEQERLRNTANWMDLTFFTLQPRNNKTFLLHLIPRMVEGRNVRYITGSGQTRPTADRVNIFRVEGQCEKIKRPPRRKREETMQMPASMVIAENGQPLLNDDHDGNRASAREAMILQQKKVRKVKKDEMTIAGSADLATSAVHPFYYYGTHPLHIQQHLQLQQMQQHQIALPVQLYPAESAMRSYYETNFRPPLHSNTATAIKKEGYHYSHEASFHQKYGAMYPNPSVGDDALSVSNEYKDILSWKNIQRRGEGIHSSISTASSSASDTNSDNDPIENDDFQSQSCPVPCVSNNRVIGGLDLLCAVAMNELQ